MGPLSYNGILKSLKHPETRKVLRPQARRRGNRRLMWFGYIDPGTGYAWAGMGAVFYSLWGAAAALLAGWGRRLLGRKPGGAGRWVLGVVAVAAVGMAVWAVCNMKTAPVPNVVLLGFDGLSPEIVEPMMQRGELPHFARLAREGAYRKLSTSNPSQSPVAWACAATGVNPGRHGVFDFIVRNPATGRLSLAFGMGEGMKPRRALQAKALWQYAGDMGITSVVLQYPDTFPPPRIRGRMLAGMGVPDVLGTQGTFTVFYSGQRPGTDLTAGRAVEVKFAPVMRLELAGPRVDDWVGGAETLKAALTLTPDPGGRAAGLECQGRSFTLEAGRWSPWIPVRFDRPLRHIYAQFQCRLLRLGPDFALFVGPLNFDPEHPSAPLSYPSGYGRELMHKVGRFATQGMPFHTWAVNAGVLDETALREQADEIFSHTCAMLDAELDRRHGGLLVCYFEVSDIMQHMFWRGQGGDSPVIREWYRRLDELAGRVLERLAPEDTLLVVSDHGFASFRKSLNLNSWLRDHGYLALKNGATAGGELLSGVDWSRTRAYAAGFTGIYLNQAGREAHGCVAPGEESRKLADEIAAGLLAWRDGPQGETVVTSVYRGGEIFQGPYAGQAPDLVVGSRRGYRVSWQTALGACPEGLIEDNRKPWDGDHLFDPPSVPGVLLCSRAVRGEHPSLLDVTPSVLSLLGMSGKKIGACGFDGRNLFDDER